ncbi:MAG: MNIO family bufferin maturase [Advenella sp.]
MTVYHCPIVTPDGAHRQSLFTGAARLLAGVSFKHEHLGAIQDDGLNDAFFEVHAENYMGAGGPPQQALAAIGRDYPLSIHGVCMSIGGPQALDPQHLRRFADLVRRCEPALVSEHLAWSSYGNTFYNDLLPLPYTMQTLHTVCAHVDQVQSAIKRPLLIENPATYIQFACSDMSETGFLQEVARRTGCGLLLDINNVYVSATNDGFSAEQYLADFPLDQVGQIHLAGHSVQEDDEGQPLLIDSHDSEVSPAVWDLYANVITRTGPIPTLIEWDSKLPAWPVLKAQGLRVREFLIECAARAAHDWHESYEGASHGV